MKILIEKSTNIVKYYEFDFELRQNDIIVRNSNGDRLFYIGDMNINNSIKIEVDSVPEDFIGCKYKYIENNFILNPDYKEISTEDLLK